MDGYVVKPVQPEQLYAEIRRIIEGEVGATEPLTVEDTSGFEEAIVDRRDLMSRLQDDIDLLAEIVRLYESELPGHIAALEEGLEAGDAYRVSRAAHRLKGAVGNLSSRPTVEAALALEKAAESGDLSEGREKVERLRTLTDRLLVALNELIEDRAETTATEAPRGSSDS